MTIEVGEKLPDATVKIFDDQDRLVDVLTSNIFDGRRILMFGVPGAFSPECSDIHLPGYLNNIDKFHAAGIDQVLCLAINDAFVLRAWADKYDIDHRILMLSDGNATFTRAVGLDFDASAVCAGVRTRRFAMLVDDGVVKDVQVEDRPTDVTTSAAAVMLERLLAA